MAIDISTPSPPLALLVGGGRHRDQSSCPSANTNNASAYVNYASIVNNHLKKAERKKKALEFEEVKDDVQTMKQDMADIKGLLKRLVEKNG